MTISIRPRATSSRSSIPLKVRERSLVNPAGPVTWKSRCNGLTARGCSKGVVELEFVWMRPDRDGLDLRAFEPHPGCD